MPTLTKAPAPAQEATLLAACAAAALWTGIAALLVGGALLLGGAPRAIFGFTDVPFLLVMSGIFLSVSGAALQVVERS